MSATEAIRFGASQDRPVSAKHVRLSSNRLLNTNVFLGIKDVLARKSLYSTMLVVVVISAFIMIVPQNLYNTIASKSFMTYMGIGSSDIRVDIQQTDHISDKAADVAKVMESDSSITQYAIFVTKTYKVMMEDSSVQGLKIELGDHSIFPLTYSDGSAPIAADDIALSALNANELGKKIGDPITLDIEGVEKNLTVCGIYSDVTNGGKTAKAAFTDHSSNTMWSIIYVQLADQSLLKDKVLEYADRFEYAKITGVDGYIAQTFGSTISSIGTAALVAAALALVITILVTLLFMKLLVTKDRYSIAVMKSLGFTNSNLRVQYASRSIFVLLIGIVIGTLLANTFGELLASAVISSFGASSFTFVVNPLSAYVMGPLMLIGSVLIATLLGTMDVRNIKISGNVKE